MAFRTLIPVLFFAVTCTGPALADFRGVPPQSSLTPSIDTYPEFMAIVRAADGTVLVGSADGVLAFDGARWSLIELPGHVYVRTLVEGPDGKVHVGGYGVFGYLERNDTGAWEFVNLTPRFGVLLDGRELADIWGILATDSAVYYKALRDLFRYDLNDGQAAHWRHEGRFGSIIMHEGAPWVQYRGEGFRRFDGSDFVPVPGTQHLTEHVLELVPYAAGLLGADSDGNWQYFAGDPDHRVPAGLGPADGVYSSVVLPDGAVAFGMGDGSLLVLGAGDAIQRMPLATDAILGLDHDPMQGLILAAAGDTIRIVARQPRWQIIDARSGLTGLTYGISEAHGEMYVFGSGGFMVERDAESGMTRFERLTWTPFEAWDLVEDGEGLLLAESYDLLQLQRIDAGTPSVVAADVYPRLLLSSRFNDDIVYVGTEQGFFVWSRIRGMLHNQFEADNLVDKMVEVGEGQLVVGGMTGVRHIRFSGSYDRIVEDRPAPGLGSQPGDVARFRAGIVATTGEGFFRYDPASDHWVADAFGGILDLTGDTVPALQETPDGEQWALIFNRLWRRQGDSAWEQAPIGNITRGPIQPATPLPDGRPVFGMPSGVFWPTGASGKGGPAPGVELRRVTRINVNGESSLLPLGATATLDWSSDLLQFQFSLPDLNAPVAARYQARLVGFESAFSEWSETSQFTYSSIDPGSYAFEVRGRDAAGNITVAKPFRFEVFWPWYRHPIALFLGAFAALALAGYAGNRWRLRLVQARTAVLESAVARQTEALSEANYRLRALADADGLTGIANRRRFDRQLEAWSQGQVALIMIDLDHFKAYNDQHGHLAGDEVLKSFARHLQSQTHKQDQALAARYGGEEFAILLKNADLALAQEFGQALKAGWGGDVTVSLGLSAGSGVDPEGLIGDADEALYRAKRQGRDRLVVA